MNQLRDELERWLSRSTSSTSVLGIPNFRAALATSIGNVRKENQDCAIVAQYDGEKLNECFVIAVVCDGIGGLQSGGECAKQTIASILSSLTTISAPIIPKIKKAVEDANSLIHSQYHEKGGTTLSLVYLASNGSVYITNVGDSRVYAIKQDKCLQLTEDDNIENQLKNLNRPQKGALSRTIGKQLTQFIGIGEELHVDVREIEVKSDHKGLLLTTDGMHCLHSTVLEEIAVCAKEPIDCIRRLSAICKWGHGADNSTAIYIDSQSIKAKESTAQKGLVVWDSFSELRIIPSVSTLSQAFERKDVLQKKTTYKKRTKSINKDKADSLNKYKTVEELDLENSSNKSYKNKINLDPKSIEHNNPEEPKHHRRPEEVLKIEIENDERT